MTNDGDDDDDSRYFNGEWPIGIRDDRRPTTQNFSIQLIFFFCNNNNNNNWLIYRELYIWNDARTKILLFHKKPFFCFVLFQKRFPPTSFSFLFFRLHHIKFLFDLFFLFHQPPGNSHHVSNFFRKKKNRNEFIIFPRI